MNVTPAVPTETPASEPRLTSVSKKRNAVVNSTARWLLPSISNFCLLLVLWMLLVNSWRFLLDSDTGWHIRTGDLIRQTGQVPRQDVFSHTMPGREWFTWEWLTDVAMSTLHSRFGLAGIVGASVLLLCVCYALLFRTMTARRADPFVACALTLLAAMASIVHWLARPHLLSILLMLVWIFVIESWRQHRDTTHWKAKLIFALPLLLALWANLHGAFAVTFVMLAVYVAGETLEAACYGEFASRAFQQRLATYLVVGTASFAATFLTPYGWRLHQHLWRYLNDAQLLANIQEFQSPDFHTVDGQLIELLLVLAAIAGARALVQKRFVEIGLLLLWSHLMLQSQRHVTLAVVVMTPIIAEHLSDLLRERIRPLTTQNKSWRATINWYRGIVAIDRQLTGAAFYAAVIVFLLVLMSGTWSTLTASFLHPQFNEKRLPVAATDFIAQAKLSGNGYAPDQFGGYLIYRLHPHNKVFIDGRSDFYRTGTVFDEYLRIAALNPDWSQTLSKYNVRWLLLRTDEPLAAVAQASNEWQSVYRDDTAQVLVKK